jgi:SNF2 family DNA or RNA helicase
LVLDDFGRLEDEGKVQDLLVIAPAGVYETWLMAIDEHVGDALRGRLRVHIWRAADKTKAAETEQRIFLLARNPRVLLVNVEALSGVERAQNLCTTFLGQRRSMCVIDESVSIKGPSADRAKFVVNALRPIAGYRRTLTGLPTPHSPLDLYMQFAFLDPAILGFRNYTRFRNRYAIVEQKMFANARMPVDVVTGYQNLDELAELIAPYSYRVLLKDCYDLPPKMYSIRHVRLTAEQQRMYNDIKKYACTQIENSEQHVVAHVALTQLLRLHQVLCGHVVDSEGNPVAFPENRTAELIELLSEFAGKAIVWVSYDIDVHKVSAALEREFGRCVARFWGGNLRTREEEEHRFRVDPRCRFMVATPAAGGLGRTWTMANLVIYYSNTHNLGHRLQSEERAQAIGKADPVLYVDLVAPGTVDETIIKALRKKIDLSAAITRNNYKEWLV